MRFLFVQAYLRLIQFDLFLARRDFAALREKVRNYPLACGEVSPSAVAQICSAMDVACICYWKQALCLQRSAAFACLLRHHGVAAELVIAAQQMPFKAHAWVEVNGSVVNDKPYMREVYSVLERW